MIFLGDYELGETVNFRFCTAAPDTGAPATLSGTPAIAAYVGNSATQITAGLTLGVDHDSVTGLNLVTAVLTSGNGYADNTDIDFVITTGTVDGNSAVGYVIGRCTLGRSGAYKRLGAPAGASHAADLADIEGKVDDLESRLGTPGDFGSGTSTIAANLQDMADNGTAAFDRSTDSLQALRDHIADGTNLTEAGGTGDHLTAINLPNQTMDITGNITGNLSGSVGSVTGAVGSVTGAVGSVTGNVGGNVTGSVGSLAAQAKADVNAEVLDVLNTDTFAEPGQGAPAATNSLVNKISFLYKAWRNRSTQTATEYALYADDATTKDQEAVVSDDTTTLDRGEVGTGA